MKKTHTEGLCTVSCQIKENVLLEVKSVCHLCDHLLAYSPLQRVREENDEVLVQLVLAHRLDVHHALDVAELKVGEETIEDLDVLPDSLGVLGLRGEALLAKQVTDLLRVVVPCF